MTALDITRWRTPAVVRTALVLAFVCVLAGITAIAQQAPSQAQQPRAAQPGLQLNDREYFETRGLNVLVFTNEYNGMFFDEKTAGIEIILNGVRLATGGAVRLSPTPEQWDLIPKVVERKVDKAANTITCLLRYEAFDFDSRLVVTPEGAGFRVAVHVDKPVPEKLEGRAGLNLEFLPSRYFERTYLADSKPGIFPRYPTGPTLIKPADTKIPQFEGYSTFDDRGRNEYIEAQPVATGQMFVLAPEDAERRVTIRAVSGGLQLLDGRNLAQNGWFIVRSLLQPKATGKVAEWVVSPSVIPNWTRKPVVGFSQVGYHPAQKKVAVIELDQNDTALATASLFEVTPEGAPVERMKAPVQAWGSYLRVQVRHGRLQHGEPARALLHPVRDAEDRDVPDWPECVRHDLACDRRRVVPGPDGPHDGQRGVPRVARPDAHGRRAAGTAELPALRRLPDGGLDRNQVQAPRADPGPRRRRLVRRGRLRHPGRLTRRHHRQPRRHVGDLQAAARPDVRRSGHPLRRHPSPGRQAGPPAADRARRPRRGGAVPEPSASCPRASSTRTCTGTTTSATRPHRPTTCFTTLH